ncbi:hypothetical protein FRC02_008536 [Tulasnella sp. 418]|nr:hypothetical protein FRC02_008536 [Tulasnella sp. 418]
MSRDRTIHIPPAPAPAPSGILKVQGNKIIDQQGNEVMLRGAGLGGHLNQENFITGYPGHEKYMRRALLKVLGEEKYEFFFDKFLEYFFTEKDAKFFASLGFNCIRYTVKTHNAKSRTDTGVHLALFWEHKEFQDRAVALWEELARRFKGNTWIAGYNPLNEPCDEEHVRVLAWYERVEAAIRKIDPDHILYWDGNTFAADLSRFKDPLPNSVYAIHDYSTFGFPDGEPYKGTEDQKAKLLRSLNRKIEYQLKVGSPIWNGEWGPVYASPDDGEDWEKINEDRYRVLKDQLALYEERKISWSIWLYKDIGFQGMVYVSPESAWIKRLKPFLQKKKRVAADEWGCDSKTVSHIFQPLEDWLVQEVPGILQRYPPMWKPSVHVGRLLRNILLSEELYPEYAAYFKDLSFEELDELAASFKFENCVQREGLNQAIKPKSS